MTHLSPKALEQEIAELRRLGDRCRGHSITMPPGDAGAEYLAALLPRVPALLDTITRLLREREAMAEALALITALTARRQLPLTTEINDIARQALPAKGDEK